MQNSRKPLNKLLPFRLKDLPISLIVEKLKSKWKYLSDSQATIQFKLKDKELKTKPKKERIRKEIKLKSKNSKVKKLTQLTDDL